MLNLSRRYRPSENKRNHMHTLFHVKTLQYAVCALLTAVGFQTAFAAVIAVSPTDNLNQIIAQAQAGDTLKLASGVYQTKIIIDKPLTLEGPADRSATIQGDRQGRTVSVHAPDVVIRHLTVSGSGMSLPDMDARHLSGRNCHQRFGGKKRYSR